MSEQRPEVPREILTERLWLHQYREGDAELVFEAIEESRAELERWMPWASFIRDAQQLRDEMPRSLEAWERGEDYSYTIRRREDERLLGSINFQDPNWAIPRFDLGFWIRTSETGKGYVSEAVRGLVRVAFGTLGARRVMIGCDPANRRSVRVAEACGFVFEARLRNEIVYPGNDAGDLLIYSLIETDEAVRRLLAQPEAT